MTREQELEIKLKQANKTIMDMTRAIRYISAHVPEDCSYIIQEAIEIHIDGEGK